MCTATGTSTSLVQELDQTLENCSSQRAQQPERRQLRTPTKNSTTPCSNASKHVSDAPDTNEKHHNEHVNNLVKELDQTHDELQLRVLHSFQRPDVHSNKHVNNLVQEQDQTHKNHGICICATTNLTKNSNCSTSLKNGNRRRRPTTHTIQEPTLGLLGAALDKK